MVTLNTIKNKPDPAAYVEAKKDHPVRIWSGQWYMFWGPNRCGYTRIKEGAGVYTFAEAYAASQHCGPEKKIAFDFLKKHEQADGTRN